MRRKTNCQTATTCLVKLIFEHVLNVRKTNSIAKFDRLEARHRKHIKEIVALEITRTVSGFLRDRPQVRIFVAIEIVEKV